jgi:hypothetical protein
MADQTVRRPRLQDQRVRVRSGGQSTLVDLIFMIDGTGSMQNLIDEVKRRALAMHEDIIKGLGAKDRKVTKLRVKVLVFRDIYADAIPFEESEFFSLPEESAAFRSFVENIQAKGGGDEPENSLEAMCLAMQNRFQELQQGQKGRHILIMLTDASAHPMDHNARAGAARYPQGMPDDLKGVQALWESMDVHAKRLIVFAPNVWPWNEICMWNGVDYKPSAAGTGIDGDTFEAVIQAISGSV